MEENIKSLCKHALQKHVSLKKTVFLPRNEFRYDDEFINEIERHSVDEEIIITINTNLQVSSCNCIYILSITNANICGVPFVKTNIRHNDTIFHFIETMLPELRPISCSCIDWDFWQAFTTPTHALKCRNITFDTLGIEQFMNDIYITIKIIDEQSKMDLMLPQRHKWYGRGTSFNIIYPDVFKITQSLIIFSIHNATDQFVFGSRLFWSIMILPNPLLQLQPMEILDICPSSGKAYSDLWIYGRNFVFNHLNTNYDIRVVFTKSTSAMDVQIINVENNLIRCSVPKVCAGEYHIFIRIGEKRITKLDNPVPYQMYTPPISRSPCMFEVIE